MSTDELPALIAADFPADMDRQGITGHSMGGHGALTIALRNPDRYRSVSAFAPIVAPSQVPWGEKALRPAISATDRAAWREARRGRADRGRRAVPDLLVDQGEADRFLAEQLRPELLCDACAAAGHPADAADAAGLRSQLSTSSRPSWPITSPGMRSAYDRPLRRPDRRRRPWRRAGGDRAAPAEVRRQHRDHRRRARAALRAPAAVQGISRGREDRSSAS